MIEKALLELKVNDWVLHKEPTNEIEFLKYFKKIIGSDQYNSAIESSNPDDFGVTWQQIQAKIAELEAAEPMRLLRLERNRLLQETDWMANSDVVMTDAWKTYRQALRDITQTYTSLDDVIWPEKPE
jgi:hypothetical protein